MLSDFRLAVSLADSTGYRMAIQLSQIGSGAAEHKPKAIRQTVTKARQLVKLLNKKGVKMSF